MGWLRNKEKKKPTKPDILASERGAKLLEELIECCDGKSNPIKFFSANQILKATDRFSWSNHISELSCYGFHDTEWYSGKNENHPKILFKKFRLNGKKNMIWRDIAVSSMVSGHKNFIKLFGCCLESENLVMIYDGVKKHCRLDISKETWKRRMKIAEDMATAFAYLHTAFPRPFVNTCITNLNILVDEDGVGKLTDFSHCVSIPHGQTSVQIDNRKGFFGSLTDLNYRKNRVVSEKTDVFAFGILILQGFLIGDKRSMNIWVEASIKGYSERNVGDDSYHQFWLSKFGVEERRMEEIADQEMIEKMGEISEEEVSQMKAFLMLSLRCIGHKGEIPTMVEVTKELKKIQRPLNIADSSSPSGETQLNSAQDMSSTFVLSNQTTNT
ncbi:hypothetical protein CARUB_v10020453mg [Capsella rubella]|uniref:Protein kinase domain-containing protein n=1 Tax=Capsella rubella TaxID=81985 RepID=R0IA26_9BRAS|nr:probable inactive receptor-like protein kinase At1g65250 [Capsella rubella]EOA33403.1 hypothetical protein CARUB_v10020453mg [Capsella rubella]